MALDVNLNRLGDLYPKISIVTPSLNQGRFIEDSILSVKEQDYPNFKHIIIDGGSTDNTLEVLKKYPHLIWISEPDKGQSDALNKGFRLAKGDWILWLNADDYLMPGVLQTFTNEIVKSPSVDYLYGHVQFVDEYKKLIKTSYHIPYSYLFTVFGVYAPPSTGGLFRASSLKENPLDEEYHYVMDTEWFLRCGKNLKTVLINKVVIAFRISDRNKTSQHITRGIVLPRHTAEQRMYREKYVFPRWSALPRKAQEFVYQIGHCVYRVFYYYRKLKYATHYAKAKVYKS